MTPEARLLFPAIRWDPDRGDWDAIEGVPALAELGVGGWIVFGGPADAVAELTAHLRAESRHPILIAADLERGAGQQFTGATPLPPAGALASLDDIDVTRRAGELTAREARALGVDWVYAPVADLNVEPENPIVGTRAFGADPATVARHVTAWVEGCRAAGALACAKHFPGHGRTTTDSHLALPTVEASAETLKADLTPFEAAVDAGVESVMTAHVAFPALDPTGAPATLSAPILQDLLRDRLGFGGLVVTDALIMKGVDADPEPAVRALAAGCDALLYPRDAAAVAEELTAARGGTLPDQRVKEALDRVRTAAEGARDRRTAGAGSGAEERDAGGGSTQVGSVSARSWSLQIAVHSVHTVRGAAPLARTFELVTVDDDTEAPYPPPSRRAFPATLTKAGRRPIPVAEASGGPAVVALHADVRGFKGRAGVSEAAVAAVGRAVEAASSSLVVLFGPPRLADQVPGENLVCAWGGEALMQEAAAVYLSRESR